MNGFANEFYSHVLAHTRTHTHTHTHTHYIHTYSHAHLRHLKNALRVFLKVLVADSNNKVYTMNIFRTKDMNSQTHVHCMYMWTLTHAQTHSHMHAQTHMHMHMHAHTHTHMHAQSHMLTNGIVSPTGTQQRLSLVSVNLRYERIQILTIFLQLPLFKTFLKLLSICILTSVSQAGVDLLIGELSALDAPGPALAFLATVVKVCYALYHVLKKITTYKGCMLMGKDTKRGFAAVSYYYVVFYLFIFTHESVLIVFVIKILAIHTTRMHTDTQTHTLIVCPIACTRTRCILFLVFDYFIFFVSRIGVR